jgi:hypothetical protein
MELYGHINGQLQHNVVSASRVQVQYAIRDLGRAEIRKGFLRILRTREDFL